MSATTDTKHPDLNQSGLGERTDQAKTHVVLSDEERAKGFVRPVRRSYKHVGAPGPEYPLRDLSDEERERYEKYGYVKFEAYPESDSAVTGRMWTQQQLNDVGKGCGTVTNMKGDSIPETYARDPNFYGATYCCGCNAYLPVNEFRWTEDGEVVGS